MKNLLAFLCFLLLSSLLVAQGTFLTKKIQSQDAILNGDSITIYVYIPTGVDTNAANNKMIVGIHGLGTPDNSVEIRQFLAPLGESENMIVACPDPYLNDQPRSKTVVDEAVDALINWYNIDENEKYIVGYSAGSDVAARYVLSLEKHTFKGLIWFAPGFYSITNVPNQDLLPPVCLCVGTSDFVSLAQANLIRNAFNNSSVPFLYNTISGVAHTMDFPTFPQEMKKCVDFIDQNSTVGLENKLENQNFTIYPNPGNNFFIESKSVNAPIENINIFDVLGREVFHLANTTAQKLQIETESWAKGWYFIQINNQKNTQSFKWLKK